MILLYILGILLMYAFIYSTEKRDAPIDQHSSGEIAFWSGLWPLMLLLIISGYMFSLLEKVIDYAYKDK